MFLFCCIVAVLVVTLFTVVLNRTISPSVLSLSSSHVMVNFPTKQGSLNSTLTQTRPNLMTAMRVTFPVCLLLNLVPDLLIWVNCDIGV